MDKKLGQGEWRSRVPEGYRFLGGVEDEPLWTLARVEDRQGQQLLLKLFSPVLCRQEELRGEVLASLRVVQRLHHPHVLPLVALHEQAGSLAAGYEYRPGFSLRQRACSHKLTTAEACRIGLQVAMALQHCHQKGFVQGLLTPGSVYLDQEGNALLHEVGMVRVAALVLERGAPNIRAHYAAYMSPEQLTAQAQATFLSDVYILGLLLYELFTGRAAFVASSAAEIVALQRDALPPPLRAANTRLPEELEGTVARCLEKEPQRRFSSCAEVMEALEAHLLRLPEAERRRTARGKRPVRVPLGGATMRRVGRVAAGVLVLGLCVVGALLVLNRQVQPSRQSTPEFRAGETQSDTAALATSELAHQPPMEPEPAPERTPPPLPPAAVRPGPGPASVMLAAQVGGIPVEAELFIDGRARGRVEARNRLTFQLPADQPHRLRLSRPGFVPWDTTLTLGAGEAKALAVELRPEPGATVEVTLGQVDYARFVRLDDAGEARPLPTTLRLAIGAHTLLYLDEEGNPVWRTTEIFDPSGPQLFAPEVEVEFAEVAIVVANAAEVGYGYVFIDGQEWKSGGTSATPMRTLVPAGQHRVRLVRDGFRAVPSDTTVLLRPGEQVRLAFRLYPTR